MKKLIASLGVCLICMLCLWAVFEVHQSASGETVPQQTLPSVCTVRFDVFGETVSQQEVAVGESPAVFTPEIAGVQITGWTDASGQDVDPFSICVSGDVTYQAAARLELTNHVPYLFVEEDGLLWPDKSLTHIELGQALNALAAPGAADYFPQLPIGSISTTHAELTEVLEYFFDPAEIAAAFSSGKDPTRAMFAQGMQRLLGREEGECFVLPEGYTIPTDVTMTRSDAAVLLEASVAHTPAEQGTVWAELALPTTYEPGFINIDGWLYYVKEDHYLLRDDYVGELYFGPDGRYTSTDAALDEVVAAVLKDLMDQNPGVTGLELLRNVFDYCHQNFTYRRIYEGNPEYGATDWEIQLAKDMFDSGKGNCYSYSAIFWALSRGLGYQTRAISGVCLSDEQPHSWCIIELEGEDYIFDPQWQYNYTERGIFHWDMFQIPMDQVYIWLYKWVE